MPYHLSISSRVAAAATLVATSLLVAGCGTPVTGTVATPTVPVSPTTAENQSAIESSAVGTGSWSATIEVGPRGLVAPDGNLSVEFTAGSVCFVPKAGIGTCTALVGGATPSFAAFSPAGDRLLVVAGPRTAVVAYVFDPLTGSASTLEPSGARPFDRQSTPGGWDLSSAVWETDSSVLLLPKTAESTGPVLEFDLGSGAVAERARLTAELANSMPSLWTTQTGLAIAPSSGTVANTLWWADYQTGEVTGQAKFTNPGSTVVLTAAHPSGSAVLICARRPDGGLGATKVVPIAANQKSDTSHSLLPDSDSCAGTVFSTDGRWLAVTEEVDGDYQLLVIDLVHHERLLAASLPVAAPAAPPYLTWQGDVIVVTDVTGSWTSQTIVAHLQR
jgi:hypothetical protein